MSVMDTYLPATVTVEGRNLLLKLEDGQVLRLAREKAPSLADGEAVSLRILPETEASLERQALARAILNELIGSPESERENG